MTQIDFHPPPFSWRRVLRWAAVGTATMLLVVLPASGPDVISGRPSRGVSSLAEGESAAGALRLPKGLPGLLAAGSSSLSMGGGTGSSKDATASTSCADRLTKLMRDESQVDQSRLMTRIYKTLQSSPDERVRAAGLFLEATTQHTEAAGAALNDVSRECQAPGANARPPPACDKAQESLKTAMAEGAKAGAAQLEQLAGMAAHTTDPVVYAAAVEGCKVEAKAALAPSCGLVTADQWARLDAGNAAAWLHVLDRARAQGDNQALAEGLYRLSQAQTNDYYAFSVANMVLHNLPKDLTPEEKTIASVRGSMVWAQWNLPSFRPVISECSGAWTKDTNRAQTCEAIAKLLTTRDKTVMGALVGTRIGEGLGWPAERVQDLRMDLRVLMTNSPAIPFGVDKPAQADCDWPRQFAEWMDVVAERGEVGGILELARRSGRSMAQMKAEYLAKREAAVSAAASAASAGSP